MPATANTGSSVGTTTESPVATIRGGPIVRVATKYVGTPSVRPTRSAAAGYPAVTISASASAALARGSRRRPAGSTRSARSSSLTRSRSASRSSCICWNPSSRMCTVTPNSRSANEPERIPIGADEDGDPRKGPREHQGLVARDFDARDDVARVGHDGDTWTRRRAVRSRATESMDACRGRAAAARRIRRLASSPLPPTRRLPMLTTGRVRRLRRDDPRGYRWRLHLAAAPYSELARDRTTRLRG